MRIKKGFTMRSVMGQHVVLAEGVNSDSFGKIISLNPTAAFLWEQLKGKAFDPDFAADMLVKKFGIDRSQALSDAGLFISKLAEKGIVED